MSEGVPNTSAAAEAQQQAEDAGASGAADVPGQTAGEGSGGKQQDGTGLVSHNSSWDSLQSSISSLQPLNRWPLAFLPGSHRAPAQCQVVIGLQQAALSTLVRRADLV